MKYKDLPPSCRVCTYWSGDPFNEIKNKTAPEMTGTCRRYPKGTQHRGNWWCGEFKRDMNQTDRYLP